MGWAYSVRVVESCVAVADAVGVAVVWTAVREVRGIEVEERATVVVVALAVNVADTEIALMTLCRVQPVTHSKE